MATTEEIVAKYRLDLDDLKKQVNELQGEMKKVDDSGKKAADGVDKAFGKLSDKLKDLGKVVIAAFAVDRIVAFGKASVQAFAEAETGALKLRNAVKAAGGLQGDFDKLTAQAEELAGITIFDDDTIKAAQTQALQFGLNAQAVQKLIPIVADFAAAQNIDLRSALDTVIGGINGQERALKAYGITLDGTNSRNERLIAIQEQITETYGGTAEALTQTLGGSITQAEKAFGELQETIGQVLAPTVTAAAQGLTELFQILNEGPSKTETLQAEILAFNTLTVRLNTANTSQQERIKIIEELKSKYPDYLANLNAEKVSNKDLEVALRQVNSQLVNKLVLAKEDEKVEKALQSAADFKLEQLSEEQAAYEALAKAQELGAKINAPNLTLTQKLQSAQIQILPLIRKGVEGAGVLYANLTQSLNNVTRATSDAKAVQDLANVASEKRNELAKRLGINLDQVADKEGKAAEAAKTGLEGLTEEEKKQAAERQKQREEERKKTLEANAKQAAEELKQRQELSKGELDQDLQNLATYDSERRRAINARFDAEEAASLENAQRAQAQLLRDLQAGLVTVEQYEKKKAEIAAKVVSSDPQRRQALLQQDIDTLQLQIQNRKDYGQDVTALEQQLADKQAQLATDVTTDQLTQSQLRIDIAEGEAKAKQTLREQEAAQQKALSELTYQNAVQLADQLFALGQLGLENQLARVEEQQAAEQERYDSEQAQLDKSLQDKTISQQEYERQRQIIDENRAASEKKLADEQARIRKKQDAAAKAQAIFKLGLDTANAIVAQLAQVPLPAGAPLVALLGTIAAAQLAAILAAKPPQYADGVDWVPLGGNRKGRDTIPAMLDEGERVISRRKNERHWELYQAIDEDRLPQYIFQKYTAPALEKERAVGGALGRVLTQSLAAQTALGSSADPTDLRKLWRRGVNINNLDELAALLQRHEPSPYRN